MAMSRPCSSLPGGEDWQDAIESKLSETYHRTASKDSVSECKRRDLGVVTQQAHVRVWTLPGLRVSYDPLGALCASRSANCRFGSHHGGSRELPRLSSSAAFKSARRIRYENVNLPELPRFSTPLRSLAGICDRAVHID